MDLLDAAFQLASFLHDDAEFARRIVMAALTRVGVAAGRQERREYYRPVKRRSKAVLTEAQLLQCLIYVESEPYERQRERAGEASAEDILVWAIKHILQITLQRNAFHVAVGITQILYGYSTREAMTLFDSLSEDPECHYAEDYFRARKSLLMRELSRRFRQRPSRPASIREPLIVSPWQRRVIARSLEMFTPWDTRCDRKIRIGGDDREHHCLHALIHPCCLRDTTRALDLAPPDDSLGMSPIFSILLAEDAVHQRTAT